MNVIQDIKDNVFPQRNVRNKRTRNPGYKPGEHWVQCDICACHIYASDAKERWDGMIVCPDDWEPRQPQDFVRGRQDKISADEPRRPDRDLFLETCPPGAIIGDAISGCAVVGVERDRIGEGFIPTPMTEI